MYILLILLTLVCITLCISLARLCADIRSVCRQLEEIDRGSHIELTAGTRQASLLELCRSLNRILAARDQSHIQYERAEKQLKQNITNLAHDIRTPLTGASGYLQLARECDDAGKRARYLSIAGRRLEELADMLEKLFLYTKLANEDFAFSMENTKNIQVLPVLGDCMLSLYTKFEEQNIEPKVQFETESFQVLADEDALRRIFLNLLQNALIHGAGCLTITQHMIPDIQSSPVISNCEKTVSHPGSFRTAASRSPLLPKPAQAESVPGKTLDSPLHGCLVFENPVPEDTKPDPEQIFDLFYKADTARRKSSSGLGLFIVKELMKRMGGEASAELDGNLLRIFLHFPPADYPTDCTQKL